MTHQQLRKISSMERAKATNRRKSPRQLDSYLLTLDEENTVNTSESSGTTIGGNKAEEAALQSSGLSAATVIDVDKKITSTALLVEKENDSQTKNNEEPIATSVKVLQRVFQRPPPPPLHIPSTYIKERKNKDSVVSDRFSPTVPTKVSPQSARTLQELVDLRAKKLSKFIQTQFSTMAERNAAVKAAEEAIYAQLLAAKQLQQRDGSNSGTFSFQKRPQNSEEFLGMTDQVYLNIKHRQEEERQKSQEYMKKGLHEHSYVDTAAISPTNERAKIIPAQLLGAASINSETCSATSGGGGMGEIDQQSCECKAPVLEEKIENKCIAPISTGITSEELDTYIKPSIDSRKVLSKTHLQTIPSDESLNQNNIALPRKSSESHGNVNSEFICSDLKCGMKSSTTIATSIHSSPSICLEECSPHTDQSRNLENQEDAIRRAEEMARFMAQQVDWLAAKSRDDESSSICSSLIDFDDDISTLSFYTRTSGRSFTDGTVSKYPLGIATDSSPNNHEEEIIKDRKTTQWLTFWSDEHQREYFYNPESNEVVWQIPEDDELAVCNNLLTRLAKDLHLFDNGAVDESEIVPIKDFTKKFTMVENLAEEFQNEDSILFNATEENPLPEQSLSISRSSERQHRGLFFVALISVICVMLIIVYCSFSEYLPFELMKVEKEALFEEIHKSNYFEAMATSLRHSGVKPEEVKIDEQIAFISSHSPKAAVDEASSELASASSVDPVANESTSEERMNRNDIPSALTHIMVEDEALANISEVEVKMILRERARLCYVPLSWLFSSDCRKFATVAPLFDVNSSEFMRY